MHHVEIGGKPMGDELIGDGRIIIMNVPLMIAWIRINREFSDA